MPHLRHLTAQSCTDHMCVTSYDVNALADIMHQAQSSALQPSMLSALCLLPQNSQGQLDYSAGAPPLLLLSVRVSSLGIITVKWKSPFVTTKHKDLKEDEIRWI